MVRRQGRQAVIIIHGMGEQKPMTTTTGFVAGITEDHDLIHPAPDRVSDHRDLRRVKVTWLPRIARPHDGSSPTPPLATDFYELYWANLVTGTEWRHVTSWLVSLLPRWRHLAPRFRSFLFYNVGAAALVVVVAAAVVVASLLWPAVPSVLRWISGLVLPLAGAWILFHIGDVARYFNNVSDNVTTQRAIRTEGTDLLRSLHAQTYGESRRPLYDRITVVGHSLGSVVAYDIVRDYWTEVYLSFGTSDATPPKARARAESLELLGEDLRTGAVTPSTDQLAAFRRAQRDLSAVWPDFSSLPPGCTRGARWAVTDLVTLACPLTHADILLAADDQALQREQSNRGLPTCPPVRQSLSPTYRFGYKSGPRTDTRSWHQAAPFAATRWTNIYFDSDVVGGPLQSVFGRGIDDIAIAAPRGLKGRFPEVHTRYDKEESALRLLRRVIWDLGSRNPPASITAVQRATFTHVARELLALAPEERRRVIATTPLLRRYDETDRAHLLSALASQITLDDLIATHPDLLDHLVVPAELLEHDDDDPSMEAEFDDSARQEERALPSPILERAPMEEKPIEEEEEEEAEEQSVDDENADEEEE